MRINIIAVGKKMPVWVSAAYSEFFKRFPRDYKIQLIEIPPATRNVSKTVTHYLEEEEKEILRILSSKASSSKTIVLDVQGDLGSTEALAKKLRGISDEGFEINFLIGGPDGLSKKCLASADYRLSFSRFTFPHPLVRVILIEQLYRVYSILTNHPYHRE